MIERQGEQFLNKVTLLSDLLEGIINLLEKGESLKKADTLESPDDVSDNPQ